jgi:hypothetical protein
MSDDQEDEIAYYQALGELSYFLMLIMKQLNPGIKDAPTIDLLQRFLIELESIPGIDEEAAKSFGKQILLTSKRNDEGEQMH